MTYCETKKGPLVVVKYIGTGEGVVRAWAIRKKPETEQWDGNLIKEMRGKPAKPNPNRAGNTIPITVSFDRPSVGNNDNHNNERSHDIHVKKFDW